MKMTEALKCVVTGCLFETQNLRDIDKMMKLLEMHIDAVHPKDNAKAGSNREKVKRPQIKLDCDESDWAYWLNRWKDYKKAVSLEEKDAVMELKECMEDDLRKEVHKQSPDGLDKEDDLLKY